MFTGLAKRVRGAYRGVMSELPTIAYLVLCLLTHYTGLVAVVVLHHVIYILSRSNQGLNRNILALC
jgi:hypothetical protein